MNYIGIDYGLKNLGLSWGSDILKIAVPLKAITSFRSVQQILSHLKQCIQERGCDAFVIGLPLHMNGTAGKRVQEVKAFAEHLKFFNKPIFFQDERLSTQAARQLSNSFRHTLQQDKKQKNSGIIDSQAATIILQDFLAEQHKHIF